MQFYKSLLGSTATSIPGVDITIMRASKQVSVDVSNSFVSPVAIDEINYALNCIDDSKAPSIDGFNSLFFKKIWHIIKPQMYMAIWDFSKNGILRNEINYTLVTLVPKVHNPSSVKDV